MYVLAASLLSNMDIIATVQSDISGGFVSHSTLAGTDYAAWAGAAPAELARCY